jgi:hypothetical protein
VANFRKKETPRKFREISENLGGIPSQILPFSGIVQGFLKPPTEVLFVMLVLWLLAAFLAVISSTPLDDYVWKNDENYKWVDLVSHSTLKL